MSKQAVTRYARETRIKKQMAEVIGRARSKVYGELVEIVAREHPNCIAYNRWFDEAWRNALRPGAP